jgi:predicted N-acetyltransferase YhbS
MHIEYLADHLEMASQLASWHVGEWATLLPDWTIEQAEGELLSHTGRCIPTTFVAIEEKKPVGSASLLEFDLDGWETFTPWVASVYVVPQWRGRGVGRHLVARVVEEAKDLGNSVIYLWTAGQQEYYEKLGWSVVTPAECRGRPVVIMRRPC